jgi:tetratricopeptide (TPR) repeat protein
MRAPEGMSGRLGLEQEMRPRSQALSHLVIGLAYLNTGRPEDAADAFERAIDIKDWADDGGKDLAYLFLGNSQLQLGMAARRDYEAARQRADAGQASAAKQRAEEAFQQAEIAYQQAAELYARRSPQRPASARAMMGRGSVAYEQFRLLRAEGRQADADARLDEAIARYEQSYQAATPGDVVVEAMARVSLGNGYLVRAQRGRPDAFGQAEQHYRSVADRYADGARQLRGQAARAHFGLGAIYYRRGDEGRRRGDEGWRQDLQRASDTSARCKEILTRDAGVSSPAALPVDEHALWQTCATQQDEIDTILLQTPAP